MTTFAVSLLIVLMLVASVAILVTRRETHDRVLASKPWLYVPAGVFVIGVLVLVVSEFGAISRGEASPLPWTAFEREALRHGVAEGLLALVSTVTFNLWTLLIPGHLYASEKKQKEGRRPAHPYIVNLLIGILLSIEQSPVYRLLDMVL